MKWALAAVVVVSAHAAASAETRTYCGSLVSGGHRVPAETVIIKDGRGGLAGTYSFVDRGRLGNGSLAPAKPLGHNSFRFVWTDDYGSGQLDIRFNASSSAFTGKWGNGTDRPHLMWNGKLGESCLNVPST